MPADEAADQNVRTLSSYVTSVNGVYVVQMRAQYVTAIGSRRDNRLTVGVHMTPDEARDLLVGLQEALR